VFVDTGSGLGPFVIAGITAVATLGGGIAAMGATDRDGRVSPRRSRRSSGLGDGGDAVP